jgi:hypothetical protein
MWRLTGILLALYGAYHLSIACMPDTNYVGVVLNNGEPINYQKIESHGKAGVNFLKEPGLSLFDSILIRSTFIDTIYVPSVTLLSQDFQYDPFAIHNAGTEPLYSFSADTLIITDYWAIGEQPDFHCSTSFANDTLHIIYSVSSIIANDWYPEVKTTLKFKVIPDNPSKHPDIVLYFHKAPRARKSTIARVRDATSDCIFNIPIVNFSYSYRAHSDTSLLVSLNYQYYHGLYRGVPKIAIYSDPQIVYSTKELLLQFQKELTWLIKEGICTVPPKILSIDVLSNKDSTGAMFGGALYWTRQDAVLGPYSWFYSDTGLNQIFVDVCSSTDFKLPQNSLPATSSGIRHSFTVAKSSENRFSAKIVKNELIVESDISFNNIRVFNALGKQILVNQKKSELNEVIVDLSGIRNQLRSGLYFFEIRRGNNSISRHSFTLQ